MRYSGATYLSDGTVTGEDPSTSTHWHVIAVDGIYSAVAGSGIDISGNTISVADESITVEKVANDLANVINGKEVKSNKKTALAGNENSDEFYPTTKAVAEALSTKAPASTAYTFDTTTTNVVYNANNPKTIYLNAYINGKNAFVLTTANNYYQIALCYDGTEYKRELTTGGSTTYKPWELVNNENTGNKKNSITASNKTSTTLYPSIKAVVDYLVANYLGSGDSTVKTENLDDESITVEKVADDLAAVIDAKEVKSNKKTTLTGNESSNDFYPTTKAVADALSTKAPASTTYTFDTTTTNVVYNANNPKTIYLNATAAGKAGIVITAKDNDFQYFFGRDGSIKTRYWTGGTNYSDWYDKTEKPSNKADEITNANKTSTTLYPSIKAVYDYGTTITNNIEDVKAYIGYTSGDILGLHADFENNQFTRLGAAVGLNAGSDFDAFPMYGQRRRVVVYPDGVIIDSYSPEDVGEPDTDVDVMVYQPKFYYKVVPLKLEKQSSGLGYHIRKANYYISSTPHAGFKLHPLFFDKNGNEIDYVLFSAYEASYMWRRQVSTNGTDFRYVDSIFHDGVGTDTTIETSAVLKSLPGVKPISGQYKAMNKVNMENCALRKSSNWHLDTIQSVSANQLLMAIEHGTFNTQNAIGMGIVSNASRDDYNCSSLTGSTSAEAFNTASGMASETIYDVAGTETPFNTNGNVAVSYRGMENPWGNIWKQINGINVWGNGSMGGGQPYISDNFNFNEEVKGETTINNVHYKYSSAGFSLANANGWISAFGYGKEEYDWLFLPSETTGNSSVPVSDTYYGVPNLNNSYRALRYGGRWSDGYLTGGFCCSCGSPTGGYNSDAGGRLLFVPTAAV